MKKNAAIVLLIAAFVGWFAYRFLNRPAMSDKRNKSNLSLEWDQLPNESKGLTEPKSLKNETLEVKPHKERVYEKITPEKEDRFEIFDQMEKKWLSEVKNILGPKDYAIYLDMREQNEKEKLEAYNQYHDYLRKKHGDQFSYKISEDQSNAEKAINQKYMKDLMKIIGEQKFADYLKARDQINEEFRRKNKLFIQIEF